MDETSREKACGELVDCEERYRRLFADAPIGIFQATPDGRLLTVNAAHARIFGYASPEEEIASVGHVGEEHWADPEKFRQTIEAVLAKGHVAAVETNFVRKDGSFLVGNLHLQALRHSDGSVACLAGFVEDVTERKRAEQEQEKLRDRLIHARKMQAVGTLAGGIAHDFNNMLTVILGYTELLMESTREGTPEYADLQKILETARNGADLVKSLLAFSRQDDSRPQKVNLNRRIEQVRKLVSKSLPKMISIDLDLAENLAPIHADPGQIDQLLVNLSENASEAMPEGGKLIIQTRNVPHAEQLCRNHPGVEPGDYVLIRMSDTGSGMDEHIAERIFDPFFTSKARDSRKGTGLGLAIVQGVVQQHCGCIECHSEAGKGTTFSIYLPAMKRPERTAAPKRPDAQARPTRTILLVDDEEYVRDLAKRALLAAGYTVLEAANGIQAVHVYRKKQESIALVILDLIMPEMGGKRCLEELVKINPDVKVLVMTGFAADQVDDELKRTVKGFLTKPLEMRRLVEEVDNTVGCGNRGPQAGWSDRSRLTGS
ncbi:MAG: ATP-binding protein [Thermodesulfobacteriota bacterium]